MLGIVAFSVGLTSRPGSLTTGVNTFVDDRTQPAAYNSPSVAVAPGQPTTLVVAARRDAPELGCSLNVSTNAGTTWQPVELSPGLAQENCYWPRVAYLDDGTLLVLYTVLGGISLLPVSVWLQRYDQLRPAGTPLQVAGDLAFHSRMAVAGSRVWLSWVQAGPATADNQLGFAPGSNPIVVARSDDGGRTFTPPVRLSEPDRHVIQPTILALPGGGVFVGALDLADDLADYQASYGTQTTPDPKARWRLVAWTSTDGGVTFGPPAVVADDLVAPQLVIADLGPAPGFAADPKRGRLYATWDAGRGSARDCYVSWSDDGGKRWSQAVRVGPTRGSQLLPAVAVAPDGRVDVVLYDRGHDRNDVLEEAVVATSSDGGKAWRWTTVSDEAFDSGIGLGSQAGVPLQGDNLAVVARPDGPLAFWADTSRGTRTSNVQDLVVAQVDVSDKGGRRWPVAVVGVTLVVAAVAIGALARQA